MKRTERIKRKTLKHKFLDFYRDKYFFKNYSATFLGAYILMRGVYMIDIPFLFEGLSPKRSRIYEIFEEETAEDLWGAIMIICALFILGSTMFAGKTASKYLIGALIFTSITHIVMCVAAYIDLRDWYFSGIYLLFAVASTHMAIKEGVDLWQLKNM